MKIPLSVRDLYQALQPRYDKLKPLVDRRMDAAKQPRWHYESRVKAEESFALKLETGRVRNPAAPEDFFACLIVVENQARVNDAEQIVCNQFPLQLRRPERPHETHLAPHSFEFDDLRLYVRWADNPESRPTGLDGILFEVQIKTFLQHAWGIATHDLIYKSDSVDWSRSRIAYQVKAMLENAELSIAEAAKLADSAILSRSDFIHDTLERTIGEITKRWPLDRLPKDLRRLAQTFIESAEILEGDLAQLWAAVDEATAAGRGTGSVNLSPFAAAIAALIDKFGPKLFHPLGRNNRRFLFLPLEVDLPNLPPNVAGQIIRPPAAGTFQG